MEWNGRTGSLISACVELGVESTSPTPWHSIVNRIAVALRRRRFLAGGVPGGRDEGAAGGLIPDNDRTEESVADLYAGYQCITAERRGRILTLTLNRPDQLNAVNEQLHTELSRIFV